MVMKLYGIIGAGGFGREVIPLAERMLNETLADANYELVFISEDPIPQPTVNNYAVLSVDQFFAHPAAEKYFNIAIAGATVRERIANLMQARGAIPFTISAHNHLNLANNDIAEGAIF